MKKYLQIIQGTWAEMMAYRLNFVLWRVRVIMQLLVAYFFWGSVLGSQKTLFGYTQSGMLTYIILTSSVRTFITATTTMDIGGLINHGELTNFLLRPVNFFRYYIAKDIGDKLLNTTFAAGELVILYLLLRPPVMFQTSPVILGETFISIILGTVLYFLFSFLFGLIGFWSPDVWAPRFISFVLMEFLGGGFFPLDILPPPLFAISRILPFSYFVYFPIKVYLGNVGPVDFVSSIFVALFWCMIFGIAVWSCWQKGLKRYTADGR